MTPKPKSRKPLILWCRWHDAELHLRGKDGATLWGDFYYADEDRYESFTFDMTTWTLTLADQSPVTLDDMGIPID